MMLAEAEAVKTRPASPAGASGGAAERQPYHTPIPKRLRRIRSSSLILMRLTYLVYPQGALETKPRLGRLGIFMACDRDLPTLAFLALYGTTRNTASSPHSSLLSNHSG